MGLTVGYDVHQAQPRPATRRKLVGEGREGGELFFLVTDSQAQAAGHAQAVRLTVVSALSLFVPCMGFVVDDDPLYQVCSCRKP